MKFQSTAIVGVFTIDIESNCDLRGSFARTWCLREYAAMGFDTRIAQCSISRNLKRGTLRGMYFQATPHEEAKTVRCVRGAVYDVVVDLRPGSSSFRRWVGIELSEGNQRAIYIPAGVAHGFQTLVDGVDLSYQISQFYEPASARGVRWNDPAFGIIWPIDDPIMSDRDRSFPDFGATQV